MIKTFQRPERRLWPHVTLEHCNTRMHSGGCMMSLFVWPHVLSRGYMMSLPVQYHVLSGGLSPGVGRGLPPGEGDGVCPPPMWTK